MAEITFTTFWGEQVLLPEKSQQHIRDHGHPEMLFNDAEPVERTLKAPILVLESTQAEGFQLFFSWGQNPKRSNHYSKVIVNYNRVPAVVVTAMTSDGPRPSELLGEVRYDARP